MRTASKWLLGAGIMVLLIAVVIPYRNTILPYLSKGSETSMDADQSRKAVSTSDAAVQSTLIVDTANKQYAINPLMFGANTLFWIEDDASMKDGKIAAQLKELNVKLLRYPGGTVADNFHWKDTKLDRIDQFPYEDGPTKMSTDEFIELCRKVGAEPMLVVNTATWFRNGDVEGGIKEAADWVKYTKDKGYNVKYWEIGNETYHHPIMSAAEYADVVVRYAKAMKEADPSIKIGVNGHWDAQDVGTKERVFPGKLQELLELEEKVSGKEDSDAYKEAKKKLVEQNRRKGQPMWWPTVLEKADGAMDFAIIHWYFTPNQVKGIDTAVKELDKLIKLKVPGKDIPIALTEYNNTQERNTAPEAGHALMLAEAFLRFLDGGVDMAEYWPFRMKSGKFTMINYNSSNPQSFANLFKLMGAAGKGSRVEAKHPDSSLYSYAALNESGKQLIVFLINRSNQDKQGVSIDTPGFKAAKAAATVMETKTISSKEAVLSEKEPMLQQSAGQWVVDIPKQSFVMVRLEP